MIQIKTILMPYHTAHSSCFDLNDNNNNSNNNPTVVQPIEGQKMSNDSTELNLVQHNY